MKKYNVAVVGATGLVGQTFLKVLKERNFPIDNLYLYASARSAGKKVEFDGKEYEIIELKKILGLVDEKGKEQFEKITDFKLKVLEIAKKQINKNTDIEFDYEVFKKYRSRSFNYVKFFINANKFRQQLEIDFKKPIADQKFIRALEKWGFHNNQAEIIATKMKQSEMQLIIDECQDRIKRNKLTIDNSIAYMTKILKNKGILPK